MHQNTKILKNGLIAVSLILIAEPIVNGSYALGAPRKKKVSSMKVNYDANRQGAAMKQARSLMRHSSTSSHARLILAKIYLKRGHARKSAMLFRKVPLAKMKSIDLIANAIVLQRIKKYRTSLKVLRRVKATNLKSVVLLLKAHAEIKMGKLSSSRASMKSIKSLPKDLAYIENNLSKLIRGGRQSKVKNFRLRRGILSQVEKMIQESPSDVPPSSNLSMSPSVTYTRIASDYEAPERASEEVMELRNIHLNSAYVFPLKKGSLSLFPGYAHEEISWNIVHQAESAGSSDVMIERVYDKIKFGTGYDLSVSSSGSISNSFELIGTRSDLPIREYSKGYAVKSGFVQKLDKTVVTATAFYNEDKKTEQETSYYFLKGANVDLSFIIGPQVHKVSLGKNYYKKNTIASDGWLFKTRSRYTLKMFTPTLDFDWEHRDLKSQVYLDNVYFKHKTVVAGVEKVFLDHIMAKSGLGLRSFGELSKLDTTSGVADQYLLSGSSVLWNNHVGYRPVDWFSVSYDYNRTIFRSLGPDETDEALQRLYPNHHIEHKLGLGVNHRF